MSSDLVTNPARVTPIEFHLRELMMAAREPGVDAEPKIARFVAEYGRLPTMLNGYPVLAVVPRMLRGPLAARSTDYGRFVVLVKREHPDAPFVTALWSVSCRDSWDCGTYLGTLAEGMQSLLERAQLVEEKPHDEGAAPPKGFMRYRIEIDAPDDIDPSTLLECAQDLAIEMMQYTEALNQDLDEDDAALVERIGERVSVQAMEG